MGNYNPRQITQMRWRDVKELEKYLFLTGKFNFETEVLEHASTDKLYNKLVLEIKECYIKGTQKGVIVVDTINGGLFTGEIADDITARITSIGGNFIKVVDFTYELETDKLTIDSVDEELMSIDNVKTLFGNQSIVGTGNIDLYMHYLSLTTPSGNYYFKFISSNNLKVNSLQDLTTLINPTGNTNLYITCTDTHYNTFGQLRYSNNVWNITGDSSISGATGGNVSAVTDVIKTI